MKCNASNSVSMHSTEVVAQDLTVCLGFFFRISPRTYNLTYEFIHFNERVPFRARIQYSAELDICKIGVAVKLSSFGLPTA